MHPFIEGVERGFHEVVLYSPEFALFFEKDPIVRLRGTEFQRYAVGTEVGDSAAEDHSLAGVRFCPYGVGIEYHDVADAEIGHIILRRLVESKTNSVYLSLGVVVGIGQREVVVYVAGLELLVERAEP